jgi:hypothetical protein
MGLSMSSKRELCREYSRIYQRSARRDKSRLLDEFLKLTGYNRCYASFILRHWGKKVHFRFGEEIRVVVIGDFVKRRYFRSRKKYDDDVLGYLIKYWEVLNYPCGKRLKSALFELVQKSRHFKEFSVPFKIYRKLMSISAATIDRLLKPERKKFELKCRAKTKPGSILKKQIEIRTSTDWIEDEVGFLEIDLVSHDGGNPSGDFCQTLNTVDIKSGWTEMEALKNRAQIWTFKGLSNITSRLPFRLKGIDSDNGSEFINHHLVKYCKENHVEFTRSRPGYKNDNCYVEEKNYTAVRTYVGHHRFDSKQELDVLNHLYSYLRLYLNFFQPMMKLKSKERIGSKVIKRYDKSQTPFRRILAMKNIDDEIKQNLKRIYNQLNPFELKKKIDQLQYKLIRIANMKRKGMYISGKHEVYYEHSV